MRDRPSDQVAADLESRLGSAETEIWTWIVVIRVPDYKEKQVLSKAIEEKDQPAAEEVKSPSTVSIATSMFP